MTDKLREAAQQVLYVMAMLIDPEKHEPWQIELYDKTINALSTALAEQPAEQEPVAWLAERFEAMHAKGDVWITTIAAAYMARMGATEAPQPAKPAEQCWKCGDMDPSGHEKCDVPACGMREEDTQPAKREPLTDEEMGKIINAHWGVSVWEMARAIERTHGIGGQP